MLRPRTIVNSLSLSRVVLAFIFVVCFQRRIDLFGIAVGAWLAAWITDLLDGRLARHFGIASVRGRMWDSLGDKALYVAIITAFIAHGFLEPLLGWALLMREIVLYITRVLFIEKYANIEQTRVWTSWHGNFMYVMTILGLTRMYCDIRAVPLRFHAYIQISAFLAVVFGIASIVAFLRLEPTPSQGVAKA